MPGSFLATNVLLCVESEDHYCAPRPRSVTSQSALKHPNVSLLSVIQ
jgi:hypothetical protein